MSPPSAAGFARHRLLPIALGQLFGLACGVAGVRLTSSLVPPDLLGRYNVFLTFTPVGMWVIYSGLVKFVTRHWAETGDRPALMRIVAIAGTKKLPWLALAAAVGAFAGSGVSLGILFIALLLSSAALAFATLAQSALQADRRHWADSSVLAVGALSRSFLPPLLYAATAGSALALYAGFTLHTALLLGAALLAFRFTFRGTPRGPAATGATSPTLPPIYEGPLFILLSAATWVLLSLGRWLIAVCAGPEATGYFSLASNIATLVPTVLGTVFLMYAQPAFFASPHATREQRQLLAHHVDRAALVHAFATIAGLLLLWAAMPLLVGPLVHERYAAATRYILPAGCFALAISTGQFYHALLLAAKRESLCGPIELGTAGVLILGSLTAAALGETWLLRWMLFAPVLPWLVQRPLVRRALLRSG